VTIACLRHIPFVFREVSHLKPKVSSGKLQRKTSQTSLQLNFSLCLHAVQINEKIFPSGLKRWKFGNVAFCSHSFLLINWMWTCVSSEWRKNESRCVFFIIYSSVAVTSLIGIITIFEFWRPEKSRHKHETAAVFRSLFATYLINIDTWKFSTRKKAKYSSRKTC
jgi:hypothetical protein